MSQVSLIFYHTNTTHSKEGKMNKHVWRNNETLNVTVVTVLTLGATMTAVKADTYQKWP